MWRVIRNFCLCDHEKNALCDSYAINFVHDATENYYERGIQGYTYLNNIKFPLFMLKVLKLHLFCLPMLVTLCLSELFAYKIPVHRKWVRLKYVFYMIHDALFYVSISYFYVSIIKNIMSS